MYSYSWDLAENGVAKSVEEFKKLGINSVTLASSYHAGKFLRPKSRTNKGETEYQSITGPAN